MADPKTNTATEKQPPKKAEPWFVLDTTAQPDQYVNNIVVPGARVHDQMVDGRRRSFKFEQGKPVEMPAAIAMKFLRDPAFIRTDAKGVEVDYLRTPKQPDELGAGERMVLKDNETIARIDELSGPALLQRAVALPGGEKFGLSETKPDRAEMIAFIVAAKAEIRKANTSKESDRGRDEFVPEAEFGDDIEDAA